MASQELWWSLLRVVLALGVVLALVMVMRFVLPLLLKARPGRSSEIELLAVTSLDRQNKVALVRVKEREVLLGVGPGGITAVGSWSAPRDELALMESTSGSKGAELREEIA